MCIRKTILTGIAFPATERTVRQRHTARPAPAGVQEVTADVAPGSAQELDSDLCVRASRGAPRPAGATLCFYSLVEVAWPLRAAGSSRSPSVPPAGTLTPGPCPRGPGPLLCLRSRRVEREFVRDGEGRSGLVTGDQVARRAGIALAPCLSAPMSRPRAAGGVVRRHHGEPRSGPAAAFPSHRPRRRGRACVGDPPCVQGAATTARRRRSVAGGIHPVWHRPDGAGSSRRASGAVRPAAPTAERVQGHPPPQPRDHVVSATADAAPVRP
ncbi:hypothetical protein JOC24_004408 [Streptomyces sp. HB132]|nr:hypothetical protein [Streptomyces sp. HB132]